MRRVNITSLPLPQKVLRPHPTSLEAEMTVFSTEVNGDTQVPQVRLDLDRLVIRTKILVGRSFSRISPISHTFKLITVECHIDLFKPTINKLEIR